MSGFGPALYDFDNDGWKDLFVTRGQVTSVWPPGYKFAEPNVVSSQSRRQRQVAGSDLGKPDLPTPPPHAIAAAPWAISMETVASTLLPPASIRTRNLWMNRSPKRQPLARILRCAESKSNRDGIGARIKVVTKAGTQYNHQTSSVCYASSSLGPVHFGLGAETKATTVEIHWPSGIVQTLENVAADQVLKVTEACRIQRACKIGAHCFCGGPAFCCFASSLLHDVPFSLAVVGTVQFVVDRGQLDMRIDPIGIRLLQVFESRRGFRDIYRSSH